MKFEIAVHSIATPPSGALVQVHGVTKGPLAIRAWLNVDGFDQPIVGFNVTHIATGYAAAQFTEFGQAVAFVNTIHDDPLWNFKTAAECPAELAGKVRELCNIIDITEGEP
jgi:hypothetical protein